MENWMIGTRLVILLCCILRYFRGNMVNTALVVLFILLYISVVTTFYLLKPAALKKVLSAAAIAVLLTASVSASEYFILLSPVDIYELVSCYTGDWKVMAVFAVLPGIISTNSGLLPEYVLTSLLSLLVFILSLRHTKAVGGLKKVNEDLRSRIEELARKLHAGSEYEAQLRYLSQIEERNNLAQKIHDKVGHTLAGSIIQLEATGLIIEKDSHKAGEMVRNVTENLKEGMESIRSTLRSIKPAAEQLGINRLKLILDEFMRSSRMDTSFSYEGRLDVISHTQWSVMTDNMREALTNSLKYSSATMVEVKLEVMNKLIKLEVRDNGKGAAEIMKGMGLTGMEERTEAAGGKLIIDGSNGFSVITLLSVGE